jgi:hypothetical protein
LPIPGHGEPIDVFVELIGKLLGPGGELLPYQNFEVALEGILGTDLFIARGLIDKGDNPGLGQSPCEKLGLLRLRELLGLQRSACRALSQMLQTMTSTLAS